MAGATLTSKRGEGGGGGAGAKGTTLVCFSRDLFPTPLSLLIFVVYIMSGILHSLLITGTRAARHRGYDYNTTTVVLLVNLIKLLLSACLFVHGYITNDPTTRSTTPTNTNTNTTKTTTTITNNNINNNHLTNPENLPNLYKSKPSSNNRCNIFSTSIEGFKVLAEELKRNKRLLVYFFIPAALYTTYDNLVFVSLSVFTPTTYYLLTQSRIVVTAVVFERLFNRKLSRTQWFALFLLTQGCLLKELYHFLYTDLHQTEDRKTHEYFFTLGIVGVQIFCSCFASVYTEFLFKHRSSQQRAHPMVENVFMYTNTIACSLLVLAWRGQLLQALTLASLTSVLRVGVMAIVLNQALMGLVTATFLRQLNSILKSVATSIELVLTPVLCWVVFGQGLDLCTGLALAVVAAASCLYAAYPVRSLTTNTTTNTATTTNNDIATTTTYTKYNATTTTSTNVYVMQTSDVKASTANGHA